MRRVQEKEQSNGWRRRPLRGHGSRKPMLCAHQNGTSRSHTVGSPGRSCVAGYNIPRTTWVWKRGGERQRSRGLAELGGTVGVSVGTKHSEDSRVAASD